MSVCPSFCTLRPTRTPQPLTRHPQNHYLNKRKQGPLPSAALAFRFWQALGDDAAANDAAPTPSHAATEAAVLHFVAAVVRRSTFPPGFPSAVSLEARQAFEEFRCVLARKTDGLCDPPSAAHPIYHQCQNHHREEAREVLRGVVGSSGTSSARGSAVAATLTEELWRLLLQQQQQQQPSSSEEQVRLGVCVWVTYTYTRN